MKATKLAQNLELNNEDELHRYIFKCWHNGEYERAKELFKSLRKKDRKECLVKIIELGPRAALLFFIYRF